MSVSFSLRKTLVVIGAASSSVLGANLRTRDPASLKLEDELEAVSLVTSSGSNIPENVLLQGKSQTVREKSRTNASANATVNATAEPTKAELQHKQLEMEQELEKIVNLVGKIGTSTQGKGSPNLPSQAQANAHLAQKRTTADTPIEVRRNDKNYMEEWTVLKEETESGVRYLHLQKALVYVPGTAIGDTLKIEIRDPSTPTTTTTTTDAGATTTTDAGPTTTTDDQSR